MRLFGGKGVFALIDGQKILVLLHFQPVPRAQRYAFEPFDDGKDVIDIDGYDYYISYNEARSLSVFEYLHREDVYLTPNMTYKPRVMRKPKDTLANGSLAILVPKGQIIPTEAQLEYFSTPQYRDFYQVARNYQTRSLNVDVCSVFFYGLLRENEKAVPITEKLDEQENVQISMFH